MKIETKFFLRFVYTIFLVFVCLFLLLDFTYLVLKGYLENDLYTISFAFTLGLCGGILQYLLMTGKFYDNKFWMPKILWLTKKDTRGRMLADNYE